MRRTLLAVALLLGMTQAARAQTDDLQALKAQVNQLQERLNQLAPPPPDRTDNALLPSWVSPRNVAEPPQAQPDSFRPPFEAPSRVESRPAWPLSASWRDGLVIESKDQAFRMHIGGTYAFDYGWNGASQAVQFGPGGTGELADGALIRYARIRTDGTLYEHFEWVAEFDFANQVENDTSSNGSGTPIGSPSMVNVWFGAKDLPLVGILRAGWMKEPISFLHLNDVYSNNFMERPPGQDSLSLTSPGFRQLNWTANERFTESFGIFHAQSDNFGFGFGDGQYAYTGRVTWLPWYEDEGCELLHLGVGGTHRHLYQGEIDLHGRPSVRTMPGVEEPSLADTGTIGGRTLDGLDLEVAGVFGPWTLLSEYYGVFLHDAVVPNEPPPEGTPKGTLFYQGTYVELLYFLTGESQPYDRHEATFAHVIPRRNFNIWDGERGWGAWQVGVRYTYLDLQNKGVNGATLNDIVLALNWYLNPNAKVMWDFAIDHRESTPPGSSGWTYFFGSRLAWTF